MTTYRLPRRRLRDLSRLATVFAASMLALSIWATIDGDVARAGATPTAAGQARVIEPGGGVAVQLNGGAKDTAFTFELPDGAACPGDSANDGWRVMSYVVARATDPATLTFDSNGPTSPQFGPPQSTFRQPLYDVDGSPYVVKNTANATTPPGPGPIINLPSFDFDDYGAVGSGQEIPAGDYNMGIACALPSGASYPIDRYWNALLTVSYDASDVMAWTVDQAAATSVALAASPAGSADVGAEVTLTATVTPGDVAGAVTFKDGTTTIGDPVAVASGTATYTTSTLAAGAHQLSATFTPTDPAAHAPSTSAPTDYTVGSDPVATSVTLGASPTGSAAAGVEVTFTATVDPSTAAGSVTFKDGTSTLGDPVPVSSGTATYATSALAAGSHSITATFTPTDAGAFVASTSDALAYAVDAAGEGVATHVMLEASPEDEAAEGGTVTLTATIDPDTAAGTITFEDGSASLGDPVDLEDGVASLDVEDLEAGDHSLKAVFTPADATEFASSSSDVLEYTITDGDEPAETTITLTVDPAAPEAGDQVTLAATITPAAAGTVTFKDGETELGTADVDLASAQSDALTAQATTATAAYVIPSLSEGTHSFSAAFTPTDGDAFAAASTAESVTLTAAAATTDTTAGPLPAGGDAGVTTGGGTLPVTGGKVSLALWGILLVILGRMSILLGRTPALRMAGPE